MVPLFIILSKKPCYYSVSIYVKRGVRFKLVLVVYSGIFVQPNFHWVWGGVFFSSGSAFRSCSKYRTEGWSKCARAALLQAAFWFGSKRRITNSVSIPRSTFYAMSRAGFILCSTVRINTPSSLLLYRHNGDDTPQNPGLCLEGMWKSSEILIQVKRCHHRY